MATSIFKKLRDNQHSVQTSSPIETLTIPIYLTMLIAVGCFSITFLATPFTWGAGPLNREIACFATFAGCAMLLRRYGHPRIAGPFEAFALIAMNGLTILTATALLSATALPLADKRLIAADAVLGFDWLSLWHWIEQRPALIPPMTRIYYTLDWQPFLLFILLFVTNRGDRCWTFLNAWVAGLVIVVAIYPLFPAQGALNYFGVAQLSPHAAAFLPIMEGLRDGTLRTIDGRVLQGMVTFPSFHAAAAIYLAWGYADFKWLRVPFIMLNLAMLLTAIPIGGHYLVDIIAGVLLAGITLIGAIRFERLVRVKSGGNDPVAQTELACS